MVKRKATYQRRRAPAKRARSSYSSRSKISTRAPKRRASSRRVGSYMRKAMKVAGGVVGSYFGNPALGASIGGSAASAIGSITGYGDYKINSNTVLTDSVPQFTSSNRGMRVRHREFIGDIVTSGTAGAFNINQFPINPGMPNTFPWLASIADGFEQYRIHGMIFEYKSMSSDSLGSNNPALGTVILATQYNVLDKPFTTKQQMENYEFSASVKSSQSVIHPVECAKEETPLHVLYTRTVTSQVSSSDMRLYDYAQFNIATIGFSNSVNVNLGELWVSYDIEFFKPRMLGLSGGIPVGATDVINLYSDSSATQAPTSGSPLGLAGSAAYLQNQIGVRVISTTQFTVPGTFTGVLCFVLSYYGTSAPTATPALPSFNLGSSGYITVTNSFFPTTAVRSECNNGNLQTSTGNFPNPLVKVSYLKFKGSPTGDYTITCQNAANLPTGSGSGCLTVHVVSDTLSAN